MPNARIQFVGDSDAPATPQADGVLVYVRVSMLDTTRQTLSPEAQTRICRDYCRLHGLGNPTVISERGSAKSIAGRPELQRILAMCRAGQVEHLVVQDTTRLFREVREALNTFAELADLGVKVHSAVEGGPLDSSASAQLQQNVKLAFGQYERQIISERTKRAIAHKIVKPAPGQNPAMAWKAAHGKSMHGGVAPMGYRIRGKKARAELVPYWPEMAFIKYIRDLNARGMSVRKIARRLLMEGYVNRLGRPYGYMAVHRMIHSPLYMEPPDGTDLPRKRKRKAGPDVLQGIPRSCLPREPEAGGGDGDRHAQG